jgi:hypothetical protein
MRMKNLFILAVIMLIHLTIRSQERQKDQSHLLISRGTFFTGFNSKMAFGMALPQGDLVYTGNFKPRFGFFVRDRMSFGISYQGMGHSYTTAPRLRLYSAAEFEMDYYWLAKKNFFLYTKTGLRLTQSPTGLAMPHKQKQVDLKLGAGISWRFKKLPRLGVNIEAAYYLDPELRRPLQKFPEITFGIGYFFHAKKRAKNN